MYDFETNTFRNVWKSKIRITDLYEFIWHMYESQVIIVDQYQKFLNQNIRCEHPSHTMYVKTDG